MTKEQKFYQALQDIFVGAKVEGESGFINLMRIKSMYYEKGVFPKLQKDIEESLKPFPEFKEELFDKLYTFFNRYFSKSGSIYFRHTPIHQNIYEKVYTDDKDVMLFWKTHMLYYVKTDRLFKNLEVDIDGYKFFFDVSTLEHKRANEKRQIIYVFKKKRGDNVILFNVSYSERGKKTKIIDILKALKKEGLEVKEDILEKAFRVFEKQSEVDYFINKNAKEFLKEQFDIWLYQYVFTGESEWTEIRIKQLQVLKNTAFNIIDFISQFEDELVKIWNKPKFVFNSNYVITFDRIANKKIELVEKILNHLNFNEQIKEWKYLGIVADDFDPSVILSGSEESLNSKYQHLPIDTKHFKDLELEILGIFDDLEKALDGWLIKSENYQALNTILPKFKEKVQTIYIDPPFNTGEDFDYIDKFQDSTWITLIHNRLQIAKTLLTKKGNCYLHLDDNANHYGKIIMNSIFNNLKNEISWCYRWYEHNESNWNKKHDTILYYWISGKSIFNWEKVATPLEKNSLKKFRYTNYKGRKFCIRGRNIKGSPVKQKANLTLEDEEKYPSLTYRQYLDEVIGVKPRDWFVVDILAQGNPEIYDFKTQKPEKLLKKFIEASSNENDLICDFFAGSGTSLSVSHKLGRKWIGIEMSELFWEKYYDIQEDKIKTGILGRLKEVLYCNGNHEPCGITTETNWRGGGFFKYYELEQYEDTLRKVKYEDSDLFDNPNQDPYNQYVFMRDLKMLEALEIDYENNKVKVDLSKLYKNIDIPETLSNLLGRWIKKITADEVEFEDGEKIGIKDLDYKLIKPLIWW